MANRAKNATRATQAEQTRTVLRTETALLERGEKPAEPRWLADIRARLPTTWARVSTVALACDVSSTTVRAWVETRQIIAVDYAAREERAAWNIYVPSVIAFLASREGGRKQ